MALEQAIAISLPHVLGGLRVGALRSPVEQQLRGLIATFHLQAALPSLKVTLTFTVSRPLAAPVKNVSWGFQVSDLLFSARDHQNCSMRHALDGQDLCCILGLRAWLAAFQC